MKLSWRMWEATVDTMNNDGWNIEWYHHLPVIYVTSGDISESYTVNVGFKG